MTLEMKIRRILDKYDDDMEALSKEYECRFIMAGKAEDILELNMWHVQKLNEIKKEYIESIKEMERA